LMDDCVDVYFSESSLQRAQNIGHVNKNQNLVLSIFLTVHIPFGILPWLKSHLFSLSYPTFWLFCHLYGARALIILDTSVAITFISVVDIILSKLIIDAW